MRSVSEPLKNFIIATTGRPCGVAEVPNGAEKPFYNIHPYPGPEDGSTMGQPNSIGFQVFSIDIVGSSVTQVDEAEYRLTAALRDLHRSVDKVYGPPTVRKNGQSREDDRTFRTITIVTVPVTE